MDAAAWRIKTKNKKEFNYWLQVENVVGVRAKNRILKSVQDWSTVGEGHNKGESFVLLFSRTFENEESWIKWARNFPYELIELKKDGRPKPIKLGSLSRKRRNKKK